MLLRLIRSHVERRAAVRRQAETLMASSGDGSWAVARERASAIFEDSAGRDFAWDVVAYIERELKIDWQPDTATRYLARTPKRRVRASQARRLQTAGSGPGDGT